MPSVLKVPSPIQVKQVGVERDGREIQPLATLPLEEAKRLPLFEKVDLGNKPYLPHMEKFRGRGRICYHDKS